MHAIPFGWSLVALGASGFVAMAIVFKSGLGERAACRCFAAIAAVCATLVAVLAEVAS